MKNNSSCTTSSPKYHEKWSFPHLVTFEAASRVFAEIERAEKLENRVFLKKGSKSWKTI